MLTTHNTRDCYSAIAAKPYVLQTKYVAGSNYKNKNMFFNLTYRENFIYSFSKS